MSFPSFKSFKKKGREESRPDHQRDAGRKRHKYDHDRLRRESNNGEQHIDMAPQTLNPPDIDNYLENIARSVRSRSKHDASAKVAHSAEAKSEPINVPNADDLFVVDVTGDQNNQLYEKRNRYALIKYRRSFAHVLDLPPKLYIKKSKTEFQNCEITLNLQGEAPLQFKVPKRPTPLWPGIADIAHDERDFVAIETDDTVAPAHNNPYLIRRSRLQDLVDRDPNNPQLWIDVYENELCILGAKHRKLSPVQCEGLSAIFDRALKVNPGNRQLIRKSMKLKESYLSPGKMVSAWREITQQYPAEADFWFGLMDACWRAYGHLSFFDFVDKMIREHSVFDLLRMKIKQGSAPKSVGSLVIHKLATYYQKTGYNEIAVALVQAVIEISAFSPFVNDNDSIDLPLKTCKSFREFWELECPRFGEIGSKGWKNTLDPKVSGSAGHTFPSRSVDPVVDRDPYKVVLFDDIEPFLIQLSDRESITNLLYALLDILGVSSSWPYIQGGNMIKQSNVDIDIVYRIVIQSLSCPTVAPSFYQWAIEYVFESHFYLKVSKAILKREPYRTTLGVWSVFVFLEFRRKNPEALEICKTASSMMASSHMDDQVAFVNSWAFGELLYASGPSNELMDCFERSPQSLVSAPITRFLKCFIAATREPSVTNRLDMVRTALKDLWGNATSFDNPFIPLVTDLLDRFYSVSFDETVVDPTLMRFHLIKALEVVDEYGRPMLKILKQFADFQNKFGFNVDDYTIPGRLARTAESQASWLSYSLSLRRFAKIESQKKLFEQAVKESEGDAGLWIQFIDFCVKNNLKIKDLSKIFFKCLENSVPVDELVRRGLGIKNMLSVGQTELMKRFIYERQLRVGMEMAVDESDNSEHVTQ